jgi:hypothetical protein
MKKTAIVFPECFAPDVQATVASRRLLDRTQQAAAAKLFPHPGSLGLMDQFAASNAS